MAFTYENVLSILTTKNRHIDFTGREQQIKELCALACVETAPENYLSTKTNVFPFDNNLLVMPNNCIRIVTVRDKMGMKIRYRLEGNTNVQVLDYTRGEIVVKYWSVPFDENGLPPISQQQLNYCVARCKETVLREFWEQAKISDKVYNLSVQDANLARNEAMQKTPTRDEMEMVAWVMKNGLFYNSPDVLDKRSVGWQS